MTWGAYRLHANVITVGLLYLCVVVIVVTRLVTALRRSEDRWKNAFENNPTMYFMVDPVGTIVSVNPFGAARADGSRARRHTDDAR